MNRLIFWIQANRLGPDMPITHLLLHFKSTMIWLCRRKFANFGGGSEFRAGSYALITDKIWIGKYVTIRPMSYLAADPREKGGMIKIEDQCLLGPGVHIYTNNHRYSDFSKTIFEQGYDEASESNSVLLKKGCWIGANVTILKGVTIGRNAVVGAGSVVTKNVNDYEIVGGVPARPLSKK